MTRMSMDDIKIMCEELAMSGTVSLGDCPRTTAYGIAKRTNYYLEDEKCDWRVRLYQSKKTKHFYLDVTKF